MNAHLKELMEIEQVLGVIYFSFDGSVLFQYYNQKEPQTINRWDLSLFAEELDNIQEAELIFENIMFYIIRGRRGFLLAVLERLAPLALVRINCNILLAELDKESRRPKGLTRFFKKQS